jgi:hypothetical protein
LFPKRGRRFEAERKAEIDVVVVEPPNAEQMTVGRMYGDATKSRFDVDFGESRAGADATHHSNRVIEGRVLERHIADVRIDRRAARPREVVNASILV